MKQLNTIIIVFLLFLLSCQTEEKIKEVVLAEVSDFSLMNNSLASIEREIGIWGGGSKKAFRAIEQENCTHNANSAQLVLKMGKEAFFQVSPMAIGLPLSWKNADELEIALSANKESTILLEIMGSRSRIQKEISLNSKLQKYIIDVREVPLFGGLEEEVLKIKVISSDPIELVVHQLKVLDTHRDLPVVDQWGQRNLYDYPGKIRSEEELNNFQNEADFLASLKEVPTVDKFGGYTKHNLTLSAKGFFNVQQVGEKWYLVSPEGNPFYSLGLNGVRRKSTLNNAALTRIEGREDLFEKIPSYVECPECYNEDTTHLSFYNYNVKKKYTDYDAWIEQVKTRLNRIGFNTIGNWSDSLFIGSNFPYTFTLDTRKGTGLKMANGLPDVFHPEWEARLENSFSDIASLKDDPYVIGYFVDNEMGWRSITRWDSTSYTFKHLSTLTDEESQKKAYTERYFSTVKNAIKKHAPNHLYLGCRFTRNFDGLKKIAQIAGKHVDVLSINVYSEFPIREELDEWYAAVKKPMIISEHHIPPATDRALLPIYEAFELQQRNAMLKNYLQTWLTFPYAVGSHWYQFADQEIAGRMDGGENQPVGIVSITDQLHRPIVNVYNEMAIEIAKAYVSPLEQ